MELMEPFPHHIAGHRRSMYVISILEKVEAGTLFSLILTRTRIKHQEGEQPK
jgi:hypothetical protein